MFQGGEVTTNNWITGVTYFMIKLNFPQWKRLKKSSTTRPPLIDNGWEINSEGVIFPVKCLELPAPKGVIDFRKCECKRTCTFAKCSCLLNSLVCIALSKCSDWNNTGQSTL